MSRIQYFVLFPSCVYMLSQFLSSYCSGVGSNCVLWEPLVQVLGLTLVTDDHNK